jgi:hypothetical protein
MIVSRQRNAVGTREPRRDGGAPDPGGVPATNRSHRRYVLAVLAVFVLLSSGATGVASADCSGITATGTNENRSAAGALPDAPPGLETQVRLFPAAGTVEIHAEYPARSAAEAERYETGTANLSWLAADDRLHAAFAERPGSLGSRCDVVTGVTDPVASESEFGDVGATLTYRWTDVFGSNRSELVLGPVVSQHLANGTYVEVSVPADGWATERSTVETGSDGTHGQYRVHWWTVGETDEEPRVVFNESVTRTDTPVTAEDGALGPSGGIRTTLLAMLSVALIESTRHERRD